MIPGPLVISFPLMEAEGSAGGLSSLCQPLQAAKRRECYIIKPQMCLNSLHIFPASRLSDTCLVLFIHFEMRIVSRYLPTQPYHCLWLMEIKSCIRGLSGAHSNHEKAGEAGWVMGRSQGLFRGLGGKIRRIVSFVEVLLLKWMSISHSLSLSFWLGFILNLTT